MSIVVSRLTIIFLETTIATTNDIIGTHLLTESDKQKIFAIFGYQVYPQSPYNNNLHRFIFAMRNVNREDYFYFKFFDYGKEQYRHGYGWSNFWGGGLVKIFLNISSSTYSLQVSAT